ncbi:hypothetical protein NW768_004127 [Fusarium equiseti]|uniref:Dipeptidyl-peptidase V n=1 Tax=Fusarium equiseti TaxID=61235 RepID=A0ABQ8RJN0_FUSEQ|nr:hypothetical protein NW768_004127 [Fusarium equiseti]
MSQSTSSFDRTFAESLCDLQVPKAIKFSPDGQKVVYSTSLVGGQRKGKNHVSTLWLATNEADSSRQLTLGTSNDTNPTWHPRDNSRIAFLSDRAKPGERSAIWLLSLEGGDPLPLTKEDNEQSIESYAFSPSGDTIAYVSPDEKEKGDEEDDEKPEVWGENWEYAKLRLVDLKNLETKVLVGKGHNGEIAWSPDGQSLAFTSTASPHIEEAMLTGTFISTVDVTTGEVKHLCTVTNEPYNLIWAPDGKIYFITGTPPDKDSGGRAVYAINPTATTEFTHVACGKDHDAGDIRIVGDGILVNRQVGLVDVISDLDGEDVFAENKEMWAWDVYKSPTGIATLAASLSDVNTPYEVFIIQGRGKERIKVSNHGKPVENHSFGTCDTFTCQSSDGEVELYGLYLTPARENSNGLGKPKKPLPTIVLIHGGPRDRNCDSFDTSCFNWGPYLLSKGYGVLLPQYRGGSGRGEKFAMYSVGGQGKYDYQDIMTITDAAIKKGFADPERLMVGGWSQGGLLTYLCSVRNGDHGLGWRFKAAIAGAGVVDIESLAITADLGSTYEVELARGHTIWTLPHDDTRNRQGSAIWEVYTAMQRSYREGKPVIPPVLILHGEKDERCPFSQAEGFRRALRHWGLKCEFVKYPGEGHGIERQAYWLDMLERVGRWCDLYIGDSETRLSIR